MKKILAAVLLSAIVLSASGCSLLGIFTPATSSSSPSTPSVSEVSGAPSDSPASSPAGILGDFSATDIDGAAVDQSVFSGHKLTMVNVWATFCGPCINEMPELGELNRNFADRGFQVVGIVADASDGVNVDTGMVATANDIIEQTGADYLHILPSADLVNAFLKDVQAVPTTIFVDEQGKQVGEQYVGSHDYDGWSGIVEGLLEGIG